MKWFVVATVSCLLLNLVLVRRGFVCGQNDPTPPGNCMSSSSLVGFSADLMMVQHQLRGKIQILDGCSFQVSHFDMIAGQDVCWWGSLGDDFFNLTNGFVISTDKLNQTYKNDTLLVKLFNHTWDEIRIISVWDRAFASDFGHVVLIPPDSGSGPAPSVSPPPNSEPPVNKNESETTVAAAHVKQPMMFENCITLSSAFRLRWTLSEDSQFVDLGLEAIVSKSQYMSFGWAQPGSRRLMLHADVVFAGIKEDGTPFAEDYYITKYSECTWGEGSTAVGVCPDYRFLPLDGNDNNITVNNTELIYGQRVDGVSLVRYRRPLQSPDLRFDVLIHPNESMSVIWALGPIKPPNTLRPSYLPANHGGPYRVTFGTLLLNLSSKADHCTGPLEASDDMEEEEIVADKGSVIVVTTGSPSRYPNPPSPEKVIYLNKLGTPVLKVERGVPVVFSIQAGHDVAFCVTSDPVGGESISNDTLYAGGANFHGVVASPLELEWVPDRNTPDEVFYQSCFDKKMGWKVKVVDGGLSDMYKSSVILAEQMVTLFWTLTENDISFAVRGGRQSNYVAIGFGEGMVNCFAYVGWADGTGGCNVSTYWIDGKEASMIHPTEERLSDIECLQEKGILTFKFTRPLNPICGSKQKECNKNVIDPSIPLKVVWAMGALWEASGLSERSMHSLMSHKYMAVHLTSGVAEAEQDLRPVLTVHGFMMFLAWGLLLPGGVLAARYLKHLKDDGWYQIHIYSQYSGIAVMLLGVLFAIAELRGLYSDPLHVKVGLISILLACWQPINALVRPKKPSGGELSPRKRRVWELLHSYSGRAALAVGLAGLVTGIKDLGSNYDGVQIKGLIWALGGWYLCIALLVCYLEYQGSTSRLMHSSRLGTSSGKWVMANNEEDDSTELLQSNKNKTFESATNYDEQHYPSPSMEVQLEAIR